MPDKKSDLLRLTGLFTTKRKGMYVGTLRPEDSKRLADLLGQTERVAVFVFRSDRDRDSSGAEFVMYAAPDAREAREARAELPHRTTERHPIGVGRKDAPPEPTRDDDLPF